ncbi:mobilization protein MobD-like protein [Calothrix sp. NIES-4101]|nr:mobilization protein MobD-like protein [Calothrix sp. NIES-4101]
MKGKQNKRSKARTNPAGFGKSSNNSNIIQENRDFLNNPLLLTSNPINAEIDDWEQEIEGGAIEDELNSNPEGENISHLTIPTAAQQNPSLTQNIDNQIESVDVNSNNGNIISIQKGKEYLKSPHKIHIIDGEKGGAGKSFVSRALIEYCQFKELDIAIVDADNSNQDITKLYDCVVPAFFSDDEKQIKHADKIFYLAFERSVILNLPAQVYTNVTNWIQRNSLVELGKENSISFVKWFICTGSIDSVNFFLQSLEDLGNDIPHVFVRNMGLCDDWKYIEEMPEFQDAESKYKFITIDFPKFPFWERNTIDRLGITFNESLQHPELKVVSRQRVKNFLSQAYKAFDDTELIS